MRYSILCCLFALLPLHAQDSLHVWDQKIAGFEEESNVDSLGFYYLKKAAYYRGLDSLAEWAYCYWDWQAAVFDDSPTALALLDTVVQKAWREPRVAEEAEAMLWVEVNRGYHLFQLGKVPASVKAYESALAWHEKFPVADFEALDYLYLPLGAHYTRLGDNEKARALYEAAVQRHPQGPQDGALAGLYNNLGLTYWNEGDQENAIRSFETGLACTDISPEKSGLLQLSLAQSYLETGRIDQASRYSEAAIAMLRQVYTALPETEGITDYLSGAYLVEGKLLGIRGQTAEALSSLRQALAYGETARGTTEHRDVAKIWVEFGRQYLQSNEIIKSIEAFNEALSSLIPGFRADDDSEAPAPEQLYEENTIYEALEGKADALSALYGEDKDLKRLRSALECHQSAGRVEVMLRRLLQYESSKITLLSQSRRRVEKAIGIARELYEATGDQAFLYAAWENAEQAKSVLLLEAVQRNRFSDLLAAGDSLLADERRIRQQTAYFERRLLLEPASALRTEWIIQRDDLLRQLAETERRLEARYPDWAALRRQAGGFSAASIKVIREIMPEHAVVEFFVGEAHIEVFCQFGAAGAVWERIEEVDSLAEKTRRLLTLLQSRTALQSSADYEALALEMYKQALLPAFSRLPTEIENLLIVPDAWLAFLPFEALYYEIPGETGWERAPFLLRRYGIHYAFSLAVLESQRRSTSEAGRNILQLAPRFSDRERGLPPLIHSAGEAPVSETCRSRLLSDDRAVLEELKPIASDYRILHLSTHAGVDTGGLLPRVEFFDRAAYLPDIYSLELKADIVVLSACQTGLGQFRKGEGIMSLSRAFTYAGAKGLVSSLWAINEAATAHILRRMYDRLEAGDVKPAALRRAKLHYLDDPDVPAFQKSPYYWSGLVYLGDEAVIDWEKCSSSRLPVILAFLVAAALLLIWIRRAGFRP
jgi:CHAT domain-containing protein/Tfp pilus assembly protein PilF